MSLKDRYLSQFLRDIRRADDGAPSESVMIASFLARDLLASQTYEFDRASAEVLAELLKETKGDIEKLLWPRLPFETLFLELPNVDPEGAEVMSMIGLLIHPVSPDERAVVVLGETRDALARPMVRVVFDRQGDHRVEYLPGGSTLAQAYFRKFGISEAVARETAARNGIELYLMAGIFAELHNRKGMFRATDSSTVTRQQRRQAERRGSLPARTVTRIQLDTLGLGHLEAMRAQSGANADRDEKGTPRRAHWVRGHLFLARNGILTWRKPHVRGAGPVVPKHRLVEQPSRDDDPVEP